MHVEDIPRLLQQYARSDREHKMFGSGSHRYELNRPISNEELEAFESEHDALLPDGYREFLLNAGNGGAGPYYGLFPLGYFDGAGNELEKWEPGDGLAGVLREPFPHTGAWNLSDEAFEQPDFLSKEDEKKWYLAQDEKYWAPMLVNGAFPICHQGCAYRNLLVVAGPERGNVWLDARASDGGILPCSSASGERTTFLEWYYLWLRDPAAFS